ncbi:alpha/beta hydrolase family protein [Stagnihabitans tardus]|uniref:Dienelactone hydrolase n=1 Tax=Stagnihabitans tardus TaxID=2699202 RepID=A0AAE4YD62_9RHOB|nr:dienelactone hydrolase [Stagnihabitans tardus]NBZ88124.1 dienelactone hydrolase [Stagnihabitans tardus]
MNEEAGLNRIDGMRPDGPGFGALAVGVRTLELVHAGRKDVLRGGVRDRRLTVEYWYPAVAGGGAEYRTLLRDGRRAVVLRGRAGRGAEALAGDYPLVILSHGFPGNRILMSHFGEFLASHGYRVASIDHEESTYGDAAYLGGKAFPSTLVNRAADTGFVAGELGGDYAIIGYSMGGYGALVAGGARLSQTARDWAAGEGFDLPLPEVPARLKAILPIGPWGRQRDLWDASGMAELAVPMFLMAGSEDHVSDYPSMRRIWAEARGERHLLTFQGAGHNAAAPIPAPSEAWERTEGLSFVPFEHYADAIWDTLRMNNIAQGFALWFLDRHLKGLAAEAPAVPLGVTLEHGQ